MKPCSSRCSSELVDMARWVAETRPARASCCSRAATRPARAARSTRSPSSSTRASADVVALGKPSEREARPMVFPALRRASAGRGRDRAVRPQLVQSRRRREGDGLLHRGAGEDFLDGRPGVREAARRRRHLAVQILADLRPGGAGGAASPSGSHDPLKRWKLSPIDLAARDKYARIHQGARSDARRRRTPISRRGLWSISTTSGAAG